MLRFFNPNLIPFVVELVQKKKSKLLINKPSEKNNVCKFGHTDEKKRSDVVNVDIND